MYILSFPFPFIFYLFVQDTNTLSRTFKPPIFFRKKKYRYKEKRRTTRYHLSHRTRERHIQSSDKVVESFTMVYKIRKREEMKDLDR